MIIVVVFSYYGQLPSNNKNIEATKPFYPFLLSAAAVASKGALMCFIVVVREFSFSSFFMF